MCMILITACDDSNENIDNSEENTTDEILVLMTADITEITPNSAVSGGDISYNSGVYIKEQGVCWSTMEDPTIEDNKTSEALLPYSYGSYVSTITDLEPETTYYVRAYATISTKTGYGYTKTFTTSASE